MEEKKVHRQSEGQADEQAQGNWWTTFSAGVVNAAKVVQHTVTQVATEVKQDSQNFLNDINRTPSSIICSSCNIGLSVPAFAFDWVCQAGHVVSMKVSKCPNCDRDKPREAKPTVVCTHCDTVNTVPTSNFTNDVRNFGLTTSKNVKNAGAFTVKRLETLKSPPTVFECELCAGVCTLPESKEDEKFDKDMKIECPTCKKPTPIPSSVLLYGLTVGAKGVGTFFSKVFWDVLDEPYIVCARCTTHTLIRDLHASGDIVENKEAAQQGQHKRPCLSCPVCAEPVKLGDEQVHQRSKTGFAVLKDIKTPDLRSILPNTASIPPTVSAPPNASVPTTVPRGPPVVPPAGLDGTAPADPADPMDDHDPLDEI